MKHLQLTMWLISSLVKLVKGLTRLSPCTSSERYPFSRKTDILINRNPLLIRNNFPYVIFGAFNDAARYWISWVVYFWQFRNHFTHQLVWVTQQNRLNWDSGEERTWRRRGNSQMTGTREWVKFKYPAVMQLAAPPISSHSTHSWVQGRSRTTKAE